MTKFFQNLDSDDHMSHVAYLSGLDNGKCPSTHPIYFLKLFYEVSNLSDITAPIMSYLLSADNLGCHPIQVEVDTRS